MRTAALLVASLLVTGTGTGNGSIDAARVRERAAALAETQARGQAEADRLAEQVRRLDGDEAALSTRIAGNRQALSRLLGVLQLYRRDPPPALLVSPRKARDAIRAAILIRAITPQLERRAAALATEARHLNAIRRKLAIAEAALIEAESGAADRRGAMPMPSTATASLGGAPLPTGNASTDGLLARGATPAPVPKGRPGHTAPASLAWPVTGVIVRRFNEPVPGQGVSRGLSVRVVSDQVVKSPADARIDYVGPLKGWGGVLILGLGGGYHVVLAGLDTVSVRAGETVKVGQPVGSLHAGREKAARPDQNGGAIYIEVRDGERAVDPARWLHGSG